MTTKYLRWTDPEYQQLITRRADLEQTLQRYKNFVDAEKSTYEKLQQCFILLTDITNNIHDKAFIRFFDGQITSHVNTLLYRTEDALAHYKEQLATVLDQISLLNERISDSPCGEKEVNISAAKQTLKNFPNINPKSLFFNMDDTGPYIRWTFSGIRMYPDKNPWQWIISKNSTPTIPIPPVVVKVYLHNGAVSMTHKRGQAAWCLYSFGGIAKRPHPHILDAGRPCLGDFQAPFSEAVHEQDFVTIVSIIKLFLERAITSDTAGKNWIRYFTNFISPYAGTPIGDFYETLNGDLYQAIERDELGLYDFAKYNSNKELVSIEPHPLNGLF